MQRAGVVIGRDALLHTFLAGMARLEGLYPAPVSLWGEDSAA
jgi:hypothetical protein